jgi:flagellar assembly protein FliH
MTAPLAKFTFDLDLGRRQERNSVVTETAMATMLAEARREGHNQGMIEGERSASAQAARQLAASAEDLANRAAALVSAVDETRKHTVAESITLAVSVARKLAGGLVDQQPAAEIELLITECLSTIGSVSHLVIRCHPELADAVRDLATARMQTSGFAGRLVVMGDPEIVPGDARIEWADGGVVRDVQKISAEIDKRIAEYFAAHGIDAPTPEETQP